MRSADPIVIVGAGHAGVQLAASLRQMGSDQQIALINDEPHLPYSRPPLSKGFLKDDADAKSICLRGRRSLATTGLILSRRGPNKSIEEWARYPYRRVLQYFMDISCSLRERAIVV